MGKSTAREAAMAGIGLGVLAYAMFAVHDAATKWLVVTLPVWQVLFFRSATIMLACLAVGRTALLTRIAATPLRGALLLRAALTLTAWLCYYTAARQMPLAQLLTLYFSAPIIVTVMAAPLLGERVTPSRWLTVGIGFLGVLVASDPFGVRASLATLLVLVAATLWGVGVILMRQIARRESSLVQMLFGNSFFTVATGIASVLTWRTPDLPQLVLLLTVGVCGGIGQFCLFEAARRAPAAVVASVEYTALIWAFVLGYLIWGDIPGPAIFAGAALILLAGAIMVVFERRG